MRALTCLLFLIGLVATTTAADTPSRVPAAPTKGQGGKLGTFKAESLEIAGKKREFRLVTPAKVNAEKALPLVFAFHGTGDNKDLMAWYSQLDKLAEAKGFLLVYPNARGAFWPLLPDWAKEDLELFDAIYDRVSQEYNVDLNRVFLTGMSNGAYFCHIVASRRAEKIAAIAPHSGGLGLIAIGGVHVKNKYGVVVVHGEKDVIVKVDEGRKTRDAYVKWDHPVEYIELADHNHFWGTKHGINEKIWKFFEEHPRRMVEAKK